MIRSVEKALRILDVVAAKGRVSLKELSDLTSLPKSTVCRLTQTLESAGYLFQEENNGLYYISYKFFQIGQEQLEHFAIRDCVYPGMKRLASVTGHTVNLAVLDGNKVLFLEKIVGSPYGAGIRVGSRVDPYQNAAGKAILAYLPEQRVDQILMELAPLEKLTEYTITDVGELKRELEITRRRGYAINQQETAYGDYAIAAYLKHFPIREGASISISSRKGSLDSVLQYVGLLIETCDAISKKLKQP